MASRLVRETVRDWLTTFSALPFYDTVNIEQNPIEDAWCTVDWGFSFPTKTTYCNDIREDGTFQVIFFGPVGQGDDELIMSAETTMELLLSQVDPTGRVSLTQYNGAEDFADENYYGISFLVDYEFQRP